MFDKVLEYELTDDLMLELLRNQRPSGRFWLLIGACIAAMAGYGLLAGEVEMLAQVIVLLPLLAFGAWWSRRRQVADERRTHQLLATLPHRRCRLRFHDGGVEFENAFGRAILPVDSLVGVQSVGACTYIFVWGWGTIYFPTRLIDQDLANFVVSIFKRQ